MGHIRKVYVSLRLNKKGAFWDKTSIYICSNTASYSSEKVETSQPPS